MCVSVSVCECVGLGLCVASAIFLSAGNSAIQNLCIIIII